MKAEILDSRIDGSTTCYLSKILLEDYVNKLPSTYQDYEVQREIVTNVYLDKLVDTVIYKKHIPPIVLVLDAGKYNEANDFLEIADFKILDGLQRTFRLLAIRETIKYCLEILQEPSYYLSWNKFKFSREFSKPMREINSSTDVLRSILQGINDFGSEEILKTFQTNYQWFEIWTGLTPDEEVHKMLTLNAGHKPVKLRHQLELLFLNLLPLLREIGGSNFRLVREKEVSAMQFSKERECGTYHFAHLITSLISFYSGRAVAPSSNIIQNIQNTEANIDESSDFISPKFLEHFVKFITKLDQLLSDQYGNIGTTWLGREVALAGLFGGLGSSSDNTDDGRVDTMNKFILYVESTPTLMNLSEFENVRNTLDLSKVNFGEANRKAVYLAVKHILSQGNVELINWANFFKPGDI